jgi:predicted DNA-binding transcriptional regulator AlpA
MIAVAAPAPDDGTMLRAKDVAQQLQVTIRALRRMSDNGEFPKLIRLSARQWRVNRVEFESWKAKLLSGAPTAKKASRRKAPRKRAEGGK